jgi:glucose uptake protein GlcU
MELAILIAVTVVIIGLAVTSKSRRQQKSLKNRQWTKEDADTLITTVIPTINNDELNK